MEKIYLFYESFLYLFLFQIYFLMSFDILVELYFLKVMSLSIDNLKFFTKNVN